MAGEGKGTRGRPVPIPGLLAGFEASRLGLSSRWQGDWNEPLSATMLGPHLASNDRRVRAGREPSLASVSWSGAAFIDFSREGFRQVHWANNTLLDWTYAAIALIVVWIVTRAIHAIVASRLRASADKTATQVDDVVVDVIQSTAWYFHAALALMVARHFAELSPRAADISRYLIVIALAVQAGIWATTASGGAVKIWAGKHAGGQGATMAAGIRFISRLVIWLIVGLFVLSNLGVEISAVIAGLGVGGIAAALAVQSILGDLFAGLSMYFDRPFDIGDSIQVDQLRGTVERIGLRTTRVRSLDGEQIVVPNGDIGKSRVKNFARMTERRVVFTFGIEYGLSADKLEQARDIAAEIVRSQDGVRLDRAHFKTLGPSSLDYELVYFVLTPEYARFMDIQQAINLAVYRRFEEEGIGFAFPTQTVNYREIRPAAAAKS